MLTKIQGALLPVPLAIWALANWRLRAVVPLAICGCVALAVFFLCWPWLWWHPVTNFLKYLGRTTDRPTLYLWYLGTRYADRSHPWHYCAALFLTTVPLGLQALGGLGLFAGRTRPWFARHEQLVLGALLFPLVLFSIPRIAVYDGARLFLVSFPLWAIFIGRGGSVAWDWLCRRLPRRAALAVASLFLVGQSWSVVATWPCFLERLQRGSRRARRRARARLRARLLGRLSDSRFSRAGRTVGARRSRDRRCPRAPPVPARRDAHAIARAAAARNSTAPVRRRSAATRRVPARLLSAGRPLAAIATARRGAQPARGRTSQRGALGRPL